MNGSDEQAVQAAPRKHWTLDDVNWAAFDRSKVSDGLVKAVKAAAMVEFNAPDYVTYLCNVFADREDIKDTIRQWGAEEVQHGQALRRWAELADPAFDFDASFAAFREGYGIPVDAIESVRGSRAGELIARCVVETGTSSFYTAIKEGTDEPVLKELASRIAADEFRHYKLFFEKFEELGEEMPRARRAMVALGRLKEADDDELAYAYYAANELGGDKPYSRKECARAYELSALTLYRRRHFDRVVAMVAKAIGVRPHSAIMSGISGFAWQLFRARLYFMQRAA